MKDESFDDLLKKACEAPHGLEKRIHAAIRRDVLRRRFVFWRNAIAVAAAVVVVCSIAFIGFKHDNASTEPEIIAEIPEQQMTPIVKQPAQKLTLVGANGQAVDSNVAEKNLHSIDKAVRHVWGVDDEKSAHAILSKYAEADDASWRFKSDRQLQECVNELHKSGGRLYSTQYPQPERDKDVAFDGHPVQYIFIIVEK